LFCDGTPTISYADLHKAIEAANPTGMHMSLSEVAKVVRRVRQSKGMLLTEGDPDCQSAGSFFKNPVIGDEHLQRIVDICGKWPLRFSAGLGLAKVPAAWLIERAGFPKGYALGKAAVSSKHTLALVNRGGASSRDMLALAEEIRSSVETQFGIRLEMEPVMVGF
jgi:UDP-N-acetylmuramate dehydrogenase